MGANRQICLSCFSKHLFTVTDFFITIQSHLFEKSIRKINRHKSQIQYLPFCYIRHIPSVSLDIICTYSNAHMFLKWSYSISHDIQSTPLILHIIFRNFILGQPFSIYHSDKIDMLISEGIPRKLRFRASLHTFQSLTEKLFAEAFKSDDSLIGPSWLAFHNIFCLKFIACTFQE